MRRIVKRKTRAGNPFHDVQFHLLSFEGPDPYSRAGGIATRITGLAEAIARAGHETHLWFVGDPDLPGDETRGNLRVHRWCQWISRHHPGGVYDGEEGKQREFSTTLPTYLMREYLTPSLQAGRTAVVLAEEWQTADAVLHLDWLLSQARLRRGVDILWNANNTFGFDRVDWNRLSTAATITTVSRFMRQEIWARGVDSLVIPNGIAQDALETPDADLMKGLKERLEGRLVLTKIARWDPDKRWILAVDTVSELKRRGWRPILIARGGCESHGAEVLEHARAQGLSIQSRTPERSEGPALLESLGGLDDADVVTLDAPLTAATSRILFGGSDAVLANSGREPFGLVGLEAMAAGGVACIGGTGEDYALPGWNAILLQTSDPREFLTQFEPLANNPRAGRALRRRAVTTARQYLWSAIVRRNLFPRIRFVSETNRGKTAETGATVRASV
jgi:glycosyltransferase involved in cell wall biosynthesis